MIVKKSYFELKKSYSYLNYSQLLSTVEWEIRRRDVLKRDRYTCQFCGNMASEKIKKMNQGYSSLVDYYPIVYTSIQYYIHVHHKCYVLNILPWEYNEDDLIALCHICHDNYHQTNEVIVFLNQDKKIRINNLTPCNRCNGTGYLSEFLHIDSGICYKCQGSKYLEIANHIIK